MLYDTTLLITNYARPGNLVKICERFQGFMPIEIINNNPAYRIPKNFFGAKIYNNSTNKHCVERWYRAINCNTEYVCLLDDDVLIDKKTLLKLYQKSILHPNSLIGLYGSTTTGEKIWCRDAEVEIVIGACTIVNQKAIRKIFQRYLVPMSRPKHGDDIIISLALSQFFKVKHYTIDAEVEMLPEGDIRLSTDEQRNEVREKFEQMFIKTSNDV